MKTAILWDERYLLHDMGYAHPESPDRLRAIKKMLDENSIGQKVVSHSPRLATLEEIQLIHDSEYVSKIEKTAGFEIELDPDTTTSPYSWEAARLGVGGVLSVVDLVQTRKAGNAFAFVRPPGHHAERARAMGFCLFNNIAIAAEHLKSAHNLSRVMIVDFDVHHGNGTQLAFYDRPDVFFISTHRYPFYPGTGAAREEGQGQGKGYTLNLPFKGGEGDHEYLKIFEDKIIPTIRDYAPEFILVSAGFDAHAQDPLGGMNVSSAGFGKMTRYLLDVADQVCGGKTVFILEGGYDLEGLASSVKSCLEEMVGPPAKNV